MIPFTPPRRATIWRNCALVFTSPAMSSAIPPSAPPTIAKLISHATSGPRCNRHASADGLRSRVLSAGPGRAAHKPAPRSRRPTRIAATQIVIAATAIGSASTHQRSCANGRTCCPQPIGETQESQDRPLAESPIARNR